MRVYDRNLNLLTETDSYQSLQFTRSFHGVGSFEIHVNRYMQGAEHFKKGNIISLNESHKVGVIDTQETVLDEQGKATENIKLTGDTLCGLIKRRITVPPKNTSHDRKSGNAETVIKHYINKHFLNPDDSNRKFPNLQIAPNKGRGEYVDWESRYKNIADEIEKISELTGLGWEVRADFNNKKFIFDVIESKDLTQANTKGNHPVFFSPEFENVQSMQLIDSDIDLKNIGYVGGQGEGKERKIIELGNVRGYDRIETFIDARDIGVSDDEELTESEIEQMLIKRGNDRMKEMQSLMSFEAEIITPITRTSYEYTHEGYRHPAQPVQSRQRKTQFISTFQYEKDFDLGDRVDIINKSWGVQLSTPIVEITEIHEPSGFRLDAVFGENIPTLTDKLKSKFREIEDVSKQEVYYEYADKQEKSIREYIDNSLEDLEIPKNPLWEGNRYPTDSSSQTVVPSKTIKDCANGWILRWQRYYRGEGISNSNFIYTLIPKIHVEHFNGGGISLALGRGYSVIFKYIYVYNDRIEGSEGNNKDDRHELVLSGVFEY